MARKQQGLYKSNYYGDAQGQRVTPIVNPSTQNYTGGEWQGSFEGASYPGFDYQVDGPAQYSRTNPAYSKKSKKAGLGKKIAIGVFVALVVCILGVGSAAALYMNSVNKALNQGSKSDDEVLAIKDALSSDAATSFDEPFYMLLIGADTRADGSVEGSRSDTNIVVRIDPVQNVVTLVSIPRDTQIQIDGYGTQKFNAAYNYSGAAGTINEAEKLLDVEITHYAEIDFEGLAALVDAVGGVDMTVDQTVDDPNIAGIYIEAGEQHLNGEEALAYARTRQYTDGDFTRTSHQRELIEKVAEKVLDMPVTDLPSVINAATECLTTDFTVDQLISLARQFQGKADTLTFYSAMVPSTTGMENGVSYVYTDTTVLAEFMNLVNTGQDPSTVTVSAEAAASSGSSTDYLNSGSSGYSGSYYSDGSAGYYDSGSSGYYDSGSSGYYDSGSSGYSDSGSGSGYYDSGSAAGSGSSGYDSSGSAGYSADTSGSSGYDAAAASGGAEGSGY